MSDETVPQADVDAWMEGVSNLYYGGVFDPGERNDASLAERAVANLWSEFGFLNAPEEVRQMLKLAVEAGYIAALKDVREGNLDADIRMWRPDLSGA